MKKIVFLIIMLLITTITLAEFSLGASVGLPGKITGKYQFNETFGIDMSTVFFTAFGYTLFNANTDVLFFSPDIAVNEHVSVDGYWGLGTGVSFPASFDGFMLSVRCPLGIQFPVEFFDNKKCEVFFEIVPFAFVFPAPSFSFTTSLGARYVF